MVVRLLDAPFDPLAAISDFAGSHPGHGGLCCFVGAVRSGAGVEALELSHYTPLTLPGMEQLAQRARGRFTVLGLLLLHRTGTLAPGEPIVCVAAAGLHRREAIDAVDYCMDHLKCAAWFWKREKRDDGWRWIAPSQEDHAALARWRT
jgi:molybdopterin synthase catalytic subunit